MNNNQATNKFPVGLLLMGVALLVCLVATAYGIFMLQEDSSTGTVNKRTVGELRLLSQKVVTSARRATEGSEEPFADLAAEITEFDQQMDAMESAELADQLSFIEVTWQPIKRAAQTLVDAGPGIIYLHGVAERLERDLPPMQTALERVVTSVRNMDASAATVSVAQKSLWLSERINRSVAQIYAGNGDSEQLARTFRADSAQLLQAIEDLTRGDSYRGISKLTDPGAVEAISTAFRLFSPISAAVDRIADAATAQQQAMEARELILTSGQALDNAIYTLVPAIDQLGGGMSENRGTLTAVLAVLGLLAAAALVALYRSQYRPSQYTAQAVAGINSALQKISEGDFTVQVPEDNAFTADIARQLNATTARQRDMIDKVRGPFQLSVDEISEIGISARAQVEKARELTRSVGESATAATEMVRTSEEIKTSTAEAARTAENNCQQVAKGYGLTKDMSKASVDVRESVQETSKSAKRQGELIQSVTAAAEYIQALNTKISVVAINTRIEAEKAGEYGRPFLGIAESIADLLREAGEEGRKIISEVRMLQNMSADNLSSMENTVGTVVTILEYIERLDSSLEEINSGSDAISAIVRSVDDAAGKSAVSALHMNKSMAQIRECSMEIGKLSDATRTGVSRLQRSMHQAVSGLGQFRLDGSAPVVVPVPAAVDELDNIAVASRVYREEDMSALEQAEIARASV